MKKVSICLGGVVWWHRLFFQSGANPTIVIMYDTSVVKIYNATKSIPRF
jgi:hypothetical protein